MHKALGSNCNQLNVYMQRSFNLWGDFTDHILLVSGQNPQEKSPWTKSPLGQNPPWTKSL